MNSEIEFFVNSTCRHVAVNVSIETAEEIGWQFSFVSRWIVLDDNGACVPIHLHRRVIRRLSDASGYR